MPLQKQPLAISFSQGVDSKADPKQVMAGKLLRLENGTFISPKRIRKRPGYALVGTNGPTVGQMITAYNSELLEADRSILYSYNAADANWISKGAFYSANVTQQSIVRNTYQQTGQDAAVHSGGIAVYAWEDTQGGSRYCVIDSATGQIVLPSTLINATAIKPKVFAIGIFVAILYVNTADNRLYGATLAVSSPTSTLAPVVITAAAGNRALNATTPNYDAEVITTPSGPQLYAVYNDSTPTTGGISAFFAPASAPTTFGSATSLVAEAGTALTVFADTFGQGPVFAYWNGTSVKARVYDATLTSLLGSPTIETVANVVSITGVSLSSTSVSLKLFYSVSAASTYNYLTKTATITRPFGAIGTVLAVAYPYLYDLSPGYTITAAAAVFLRSAALFGKAFTYNGTAYVPLVYQSPLQPTYFVADQSGNFVARILYADAGPIPARTDSKGSAMLTEVNASGTSYTFGVLAKSLLTTVSGQVYTQTGVSSATLNFYDTQDSYLRAQLGQALHISGGFLSMYDGIGAVEHGFHLYPEPVTVAAVGSGGSLSAGSYQVVVCYEWVDNQGQTHRSAPSIAKTVTAVGSDSLTVTIPTLRLTAKQGTRSPVLCVVYRTIANGSTFFQDTSVTSPKVNDPTADTVSFTSTQSDTSIQGNPLLYTTGGVLENLPPNAVSSLAVAHNRIFALDSTSPLSVAYSKQVVPGAPVEFSQGFLNLNVDPRGGNATAVASLDDKLIVFKSGSIFFHLGQGPDSTGGQNDFTDSIFITSDVGCTSPRSVVLTSLADGNVGLMFQSAKGIFLLDRSLQVSYIGADVEAFNGFTVTSAQQLSNTHQIRFTLNNGTALVYDDFAKQWSVFTNISATDSTIWQGQFVYLQSGGAAMQETPGVFSDNGNFIKLRAVTSWLQLAGLQGFQRVYRAMILGEYASPHNLLVQVANNFNPGFTQTTTVTPASASTWGSDSLWGGGGAADTTAWGGTWTPYIWRVDMTTQKCTSLQISIEDVSTGTVGEGFSLSALTLEVGIKRGVFKLPASSTFG